MATDQFGTLNDVPDIYTDSGSDSSDDESIKALLPSKTSKPASSVNTPNSESLGSTTPQNAVKANLVAASPKNGPSREKSQQASPEGKKNLKVKKDLEKPSEPKPKKQKAPKAKEAVAAEVGDVKAADKPKKSKAPKDKQDSASQETPAESPVKDPSEAPKKKKSKKNKKPAQDATQPQPPKEEPRSDNPESSPKRKKSKAEKKDSEPKPKKQKPLKPKVEAPKVREEPVAKDKQTEEPEVKAEKTDSADVLTKMSNKDVFTALAKSKLDDVPLGDLKSKFLAMSTSDSDTSSDTSSDSSSDESDLPLKVTAKPPKAESAADPVAMKLDVPPDTDFEEDSVNDSDVESEDGFIKPKTVERSNTVQLDESEGDSEDEVTPKTNMAESLKSNGDRFLNKERMQGVKGPSGFPSGCEIYCGNLPVNITEDELRELFEECGLITRINKLNKRGVAFITFSTEESAQKAAEYNNSPYKGQMLNINITANRPPKGPGKFNNGHRSDFSRGEGRDAPCGPTNEVCVRNLNFNSSEEGLRELFSECGQVTRCYLPKFQDSGRPMGICFISFTTVEAAKRAVEYDQTEIDGRTVSIQFAQPRNNRNSNRGRGLKGRFTSGASRVSTFNRVSSNFKSNRSSGSDFNKGARDGNGVAPVSGNGFEAAKPKSIIFADDDDE